ITLTNPEGVGNAPGQTTALSLLKSVSIVGPGANVITVNANGKNGFTTAEATTPINVSISALTITGASAQNGAGVYNGRSTMALNGMEITGNTASHHGGGAFDNGGTLTITNSTIAG